jgi:hypothetical protein
VLAITLKAKRRSFGTRATGAAEASSSWLSSLTSDTFANDRNQQLTHAAITGLVAVGVLLTAMVGYVLTRPTDLGRAR